MNHRIRNQASLQIIWSLGIATLAALSLASLPLAQAETRATTSLSFSTENQPLFGSFGGETEVVDLDLRFIDTQVPPTSEGRIETVSEELPVAALQNIWQRAMNECLSRGYTIPVIDKRISPTRSECETGKISRRYCTVPPSLGWGACPIKSARKTFTRDLGRGIGPKPTKPANRDFRVGAIVTYAADVRMGVRGLLTIDGGSVDVAFSGEATIEADVESAEPGDIVTVTTAWEMDRDAARMQSRYPNTDFSLGSYVFTDVTATATYAGVNFDTGDQILSTVNLYDETTLESDLENTSADGIVEFADTEWFGVNLSPAGLVVRVLEEGETVADGSSLIDENVLYPFQPKPRPAGALGFSLADYKLISPKLDTPAVAGFNCGECDEPPLRNFIDADGRIVNTTPLGTRTFLGGAIGEHGPQLPFVDNALQDGDFFRFDLDVDSISLALGTPLGVNIEGPVIRYPKRLPLGGELGTSIGFNLEAVDLDVASFFSTDQRLTFDPNVRVEIRFSAEVEVRLDGETEFEARRAITILLGESFEFRQIEGGVTMTPTYSARENRFINDTAIKYGLAFQQSLGQIEMYGVIPDMAEGVFDLPTNFAIMQLTPELFDPVTIWRSQPDSGDPDAYRLEGFQDLAGVALAVADSTAPPPGAGSGVGAGGSSGGGGGGSIGPAAIALLMLLLFCRQTSGAAPGSPPANRPARPPAMPGSRRRALRRRPTARQPTGHPA